MSIVPEDLASSLEELRGDEEIRPCLPENGKGEAAAGVPCLAESPEAGHFPAVVVRERLSSLEVGHRLFAVPHAHMGMRLGAGARARGHDDVVITVIVQVGQAHGHSGAVAHERVQAGADGAALLVAVFHWHLWVFHEQAGPVKHHHMAVGGPVAAANDDVFHAVTGDIAGIDVELSLEAREGDHLAHQAVGAIFIDGQRGEAGTTHGRHRIHTRLGRHGVHGQCEVLTGRAGRVGGLHRKGEYPL